MAISDGAIYPQRRFYLRLAVIVLGGILAVELLNTARILATPSGNRLFPNAYVSKGVWSAYSLIRMPDATSADFRDVLGASEQLMQGDLTLYEDFDPNSVFNLVYPPTAALEMLPVGLIARWGDKALATQCFDILSRVSVLVLVLVTLWFLREVIAGTRDYVLAILVILAFFPIRWGLFCVNVQSVMNTFLAGAILAYACRRRTLSGVLIGLAVCLKPHVVGLVAFALIRKEWKVAIAASITGMSLILITLLMAGIEPWQTYFDNVLPTVSAGYACHGNQTLPALARRWVGDSYALKLTPISPGLRIFSVTAAIVTLVLAILPRTSKSQPSQQPIPNDLSAGPNTSALPATVVYRAGDMGIAVLLLMLGSPIAWDHHYGWSVVLYANALAVGRIMRVPLLFYALLAVSYILLATDWIPVGEGRPGLFSLLDSSKVFAVIILMGLTWHSCLRLRRT